MAGREAQLTLAAQGCAPATTPGWAATSERSPSIVRRRTLPTDRRITSTLSGAGLPPVVVELRRRRERKKRWWRSAWALGWLRLEGEDVARLTTEGSANRVEESEAYGRRPPVPESR